MRELVNYLIRPLIIWAISPLKLWKLRRERCKGSSYLWYFNWQFHILGWSNQLLQSTTNSATQYLLFTLRVCGWGLGKICSFSFSCQLIFLNTLLKIYLKIIFINIFFWGRPHLLFFRYSSWQCLIIHPLKYLFSPGSRYLSFIYNSNILSLFLIPSKFIWIIHKKIFIKIEKSDPKLTYLSIFILNRSFEAYVVLLGDTNFSP